MITEVKLKGWRSHSDSKLVFTPGTNALIGIMGSGKSSIMDAICFALFGTFPNLQSKKLKLDDVIMKKTERTNRGGSRNKSSSRRNKLFDKKNY